MGVSDNREGNAIESVSQTLCAKPQGRGRKCIKLDDNATCAVVVVEVLDRAVLQRRLVEK